jgi:hypothetical protein
MSYPIYNLILSIPEESILPKHTSHQHADNEGHQIRWNEAIFFKHCTITDNRYKSLRSYIVFGKFYQPKDFENFCYFARTYQVIVQ